MDTPESKHLLRLIQPHNPPTNTALIKHHSGIEPIYPYTASDQWGKPFSQDIRFTLFDFCELCLVVVWKQFKDNYNFKHNHNGKTLKCWNDVMDWKINKPKDMKLLNKNQIIMLCYSSLVKWMMQKGLIDNDHVSPGNVYIYGWHSGNVFFYALSEKAFLLKK